MRKKILKFKKQVMPRKNDKPKIIDKPKLPLTSYKYGLPNTLKEYTDYINNIISIFLYGQTNNLIYKEKGTDLIYLVLNKDGIDLVEKNKIVSLICINDTKQLYHISYDEFIKSFQEVE